MSGRTYYVYILTNHSGSLYIGVTNDLERRVYEHRRGLVEGFTRRYHLTILIYLEETGSVVDAIARKKVIKGWRREKKLALIRELNPNWEDLAEDIVVEGDDIVPGKQHVIPRETDVIPRSVSDEGSVAGIDPSLRSG